MRHAFITIVAAAVLMPASLHAMDYPFVGKWNCEISEFTFTNRTANNGSETFPIIKIERSKNDYRLTFEKGYAFSLLNIKAKTMIWHSLASGDTFNCKRKD
jgi:hypothetical protein